MTLIRQQASYSSLVAWVQKRTGVLIEKPV
jgi:hypothetical protein